MSRATMVISNTSKETMPTMTLEEINQLEAYPYKNSAHKKIPITFIYANKNKKILFNLQSNS